MMPPKGITIDQFLTVEELDKAWKLYQKAAPGTFNKIVVPAIIEPVIERINTALGQQNDPRFLGYAVEYVFSRLSGKD
jgi:hypothetical protein